VTGPGPDDIVLQLEAISERLGDMSMGLLRDAIESGQPRPAEDRTLMQARRAVDKAADLLRRLSDG
jgi:hypothetical protein